jgi:hypothetical protein
LVPLTPVRVRRNVVVADTETVVDPERATVPIPWSMLAVVALLDNQDNVVLPPPTGSVSGLAVNVPVGGGGMGTNTVCEICLVPPAPVNVRRYVVVADTETGSDPEGVTAPIPWSRVAVDASLDDQDRVVVPPPTGSVSGLAVNVPVGGGGRGTSTVCEICSVPLTPVRVKRNVVVAEIETVIDPEGLTAPIPWSIEAEVA